MTVHRDVGPVLEILMAAIAKELEIPQDDLPPSIEAIIFTALLDVWRIGKNSAHNSRTLPPLRTPTDPAFPSPSIPPPPPSFSDDEITKVSRAPKSQRKKPQDV